ncbi:hypothetical protein [Streptomyces finlayi]|uniref:hypothetical protein n=1 Tax=Streptomyces finlayi TaxID=67296 RepID=UPI0016247E71|nr:hypothetical protein [Streptomyces finlayi]
MTTESGNARNSSATNAKKTTAKSASQGVRSAGDATKQVGRAAANGLQSGQQAVTANAAKAVSVATTAWTVVKHRKAVVTGAAAGVAGVAGAAFALGRSTAKPPVGPLTRLARGRI